MRRLGFKYLNLGNSSSVKKPESWSEFPYVLYHFQIGKILPILYNSLLSMKRLSRMVFTFCPSLHLEFDSI